MDASKHTIYLTKNHNLEVKDGISTNAFMFNENGPLIRAKWVNKSIELNNGCFVILDHNNTILKEVEKGLTRRNYYIDNVSFPTMPSGIHINPFDLVKDTSDIHYLFLNILYAIWDNSDPDITAMSNLIDAFASCVFFMFANQKEKMTMETLKKMVHSVRANCQTDNGVVSLNDAIFENIRDQSSMPCKYYSQFLKATKDRKEEVCEKVATVFDMLTDIDMELMASTDESLADSLRFKTAIFINAEDEEYEHTAKLLTILLNYFIEKTEKHSHVLFVLDDIDTKHAFIGLPHWMQESNQHNMSFIIINDNIAEFKATPRAEKYFRNIQKNSTASVLVHFNDEYANMQTDPLVTEEMLSDYLEANYLSTVIIPSKEISEQDELF